MPSFRMFVGSERSPGFRDSGRMTLSLVPRVGEYLEAEERKGLTQVLKVVAIAHPLTTEPHAAVIYAQEIGLYSQGANQYLTALLKGS